MPVIYRRPDPADTAAARLRLSRLAESLGAARLGQPEQPTAAGLPDEAGPPAEAEPPAETEPPAEVRPPAEAEPLVRTGPHKRRGSHIPAGSPSQSGSPAPSGPPDESVLPPQSVLPSQSGPPHEVLAADLIAARPRAPFETGTAHEHGDSRWPVAAASTWWSRYVPESLRGARLDPGRRGVAAVAVVAVLAAVLAALGAWRSRPQAVEVAGPQVVVPTASVRASPAATVVVAVAGGVRHPGLFTLPAGSRVADAVRAAGGVRPGTSIGLLNVARRLVDGEQVIVGAAVGGQTAAPGGTAAGAGAPVNLNTASLDQLDALPGVGPVLAQRILDYRTEHGAFRSVDQLRDVGGIGESKFADLRGLVTV